MPNMGAARLAFAVSVLTTAVTACLLLYALTRTNHHITSSARQELPLSTRVTPSGLLDLIANVTQTVAAIEAEALRLEEELQRVSEATRQLLSKRRKDALWTAIHKCALFYGCSKLNHVPRAKGNAANTASPQNTKATAARWQRKPP
jgi:hypothetical protein